MKFHRDSSFDAQIKRTLGHCVSGGAEISECLSTAEKIKSGDYQGWYDAWYVMADQLSKAALQEMNHSSNVSAGEKLLRASNYYRTAYFFLEGNPADERIRQCVELSKKAFRKSLELLEIPYIPLEIPFEEGVLPGYLFLSKNTNSKLLIDTGGGDSSLEELYFYSVKAGLKRGYQCLIFEGPGQGSVLRIEKKPFRYDWEVVVKSVIDFLEKTHPEITSKIILRGDSFGGYLAARAAAYEKRISACIVNPGILVPTGSLKRLKSAWLRSFMFLLSPKLKFMITSRYWRFGAHSFEGMLEKSKRFTLDNDAQKIRCPTLVIDNEEEHLTHGEALKFYQQLQCPKKYYVFTREASTGGHCQPLGQLNTQEVIFDWIDSLKL